MTYRRSWARPLRGWPPRQAKGSASIRPAWPNSVAGRDSLDQGRGRPFGRGRRRARGPGPSCPCRAWARGGRHAPPPSPCRARSWPRAPPAARPWPGAGGRAPGSCRRRRRGGSLPRGRRGRGGARSRCGLSRRGGACPCRPAALPDATCS